MQRENYWDDSYWENQDAVCREMGHTPDWASLSAANIRDGVLDIYCARCGVSGSFAVAELEDISINW